MADTVADVLVRLGVDTAGLRAGFRDARGQTARFASDLARTLSASGGFVGLADGATGSLAGLAGAPGSGGRGSGGLLGSFLSIFTGLFRRAARNIAREIREAFAEVLSAYSAGSINLSQAIQQAEQERAEAIRRLSGRKGGRRELERLLPQFDQAISELRARQQAVFAQFESRLDLLRVGAAFRSVAADVRDLLGQYRQYVDAGGNLILANEFLSRSLEELRSDAALDLAEGEERAIEDALRLNELLRERESIVAQAAEEERSILSRGVLERQLSVAQQKSVELEAVRRRRDERLAALDQDIQVLQLRVDSEAQVFDLARDRIALETRLLELKTAELDREAAQLAALREIVAGIVPGAPGLFTLAPALRQELNLGTVQVFVGEGAAPADARTAGEEVIEGMLRALARERARYGLAT